jgi:hypothetical protein
MNLNLEQEDLKLIAKDVAETLKKKGDYNLM